jgi:CubicO group peptidase (beta-lactamase class C family)
MFRKEVMRRSLRTLGSALFISIVLPAAARTQSDAIAQKINAVENGLGPALNVTGKPYPFRTLRSEMSRLHIPGASIAVIHNGSVEWAKGYGVTSEGGRAVTPETIFQAGSVSKSVAALAALRLVEQGKLSLDTDVNKYLESWKVPPNVLTRHAQVTLRGLLSHTAGVSVHGFNGYAAGGSVPTLLQVLNGTKPANSAPIRVVAVPGSAWSYSGGGYTMLQQMMIDVTDKPFPSLMNDLVLSPLGMSHSRFDQPLPAAQRTNAAAPHDADGKAIRGGAHTYPEMAAAGLWTTPTDLAHYIIGVQHARRGIAGSILSQAMAKQMLTSVMSDYGLGVELGGDSTHQFFTKGGDTQGFVSYIAAYSTRGDGAVVMTNGDQGAEITREIVRSIAGVYGWPDFRSTQFSPVTLDDEALRKIVGNYDMGRYGKFAVTENADGQLVILSPGDPPQPLFARSSLDFIELSQGTELRFKHDSNGTISGGTMTVLERVQIPFTRSR